jgi:drug/metabolite transporter (DMT)-like permease
MVIAWVAFHENVDRRVFIGAMSILAGAVVLSWRGGILSATSCRLRFTAISVPDCSFSALDFVVKQTIAE